MNLEMAIQAGFICTPTEMKETPITEANFLSFGIKETPRRKNTSYASLKDTIPPP